MELINRSPSGLVDALCKRIEKLLVSYWPLPDEQEFKDEEPSPPRVHAQYLPVSKTESEERDKTKDYPVVLVVCTGGIVNDFSEVSDGSEINIDIHFGGYNNEIDNQGWRIPESMLWRVLQDLCANKICNGYLLKTPIEWDASNISEPPYFTAMMETVWKGCPPSVELPQEGDPLGGQNNEEITAAENGEG